MNFKDAIRSSLTAADFLTYGYLDDITSAEMLVRPLPDANHIAWALGHVISAEYRLAEGALPGSMPKLPEGFMEKHTKDTAGKDDPAAFLSKEEYFSIAKQIRAGTLAALEKMSDADLEQPVSGRVPPFVKCAGDCFVTIGSHWSLHAGQWALVRRNLGRPRQF
jgi:hypothetical protein